MAVTHDDVRNIAALARLGVAPERLDALVRELNGILEHMDVLQKVNTIGAIAVTGVGTVAQPLREDGGVPYPLDRPIESIAPEMRDGFILVPRLSTHEDPAVEGA